MITKQQFEKAYLASRGYNNLNEIRNVRLRARLKAIIDESYVSYSKDRKIK